MGLERLFITAQLGCAFCLSLRGALATWQSPHSSLRGAKRRGNLYERSPPRLRTGQVGQVYSIPKGAGVFFVLLVLLVANPIAQQSFCIFRVIPRLSDGAGVQFVAKKF